MKSSGQKEESVDKKRYVFFSDPDVIAKRAETSAVAAQITREIEGQQKTLEEQSIDLQEPAIGVKSLKNLLSYYPVQPYPFTFISAVKQKLALEDHIDTGAISRDLSSPTKTSLASSILKATSAQNQIVQKMDFIKPLKVPDLKISPKTLDFSSRENSISKELLPSAKSEIAAKEFAHDRSDKGLRTGERVQRKLDFSSDGSSFINCETIEPLKAPNVSIASNLSKKKEQVRDGSREKDREKENRSKRMKKDDSLGVKRDESMQDQVRRSRSPRHVSRKDASDVSNIKLSKNDRSFHVTKLNDFLSIKSKDKNFVASTAKKDSDKRQRSFNAQSVELTKDNPPESKIRISSNESSVFPAWKVLDKVTLRDNNMGVSSSTSSESKSKDISHYFLKQKSEMEDMKHKSDSDNRLLKDKLNTIYKEQTKRVPDKSKLLSNKGEDKLHSVNSEPSEDVEFISETNNSRSRMSVYPTSSTQPSKSKDLETAMESKQTINSARSTKTSTENFKYTEHSVTQSASTSVTKDEESCSQSIIATKETSINDDSNDVDDSTLPETLFDPRRISLRDGYSQPEFHNLMTPEKMNLMFRSKRRRHLTQSSDSEADARCSKYKPTIINSEKEQEEVQLIHPTALHMQFQAELHLYDSYNESLRQVMDVEKCLYNTKCEMQEQKNSQKADEKDEEKDVQIVEDCAAVAIDTDAVLEKTTWNPADYIKKDIAEPRKSSDEAYFSRDHYIPNQGNVDESNYGFNYGKFNKAPVKVAEVQTQTVNDIATQTDISADERNAQNKLSESRDNAYESFLRENEVPQLSLNSAEQFEDLGQIEEISVPSRIRTMSEISLHETTSSIKTETGTEISISTRGVTCSFNQYIGSEIARLLRDENKRSYQIEELFKFREKTLNDKTKKLAQLEEQKRALKDTGQDSRPVRKKQRALLLKLQQEKDEIQRLKLLYEITSQERKRMLQKQRDMFNLQMSTKNILTKLKRTADSQSPRRLSGPMKGYDIRSNSSMSSLIDSDKSQHDRSQLDARLQASESDASKFDWLKSNILINLTEESNTSAARADDLTESKEQEKSPVQKKSDLSKYELRSRKYEEKMPRADVLLQKQNQRLDMESKMMQGHHPMMINIRLLENQDQIRLSQSRPEVDASAPDCVKSESDTLVEELSKRTSIAEVLSTGSKSSQLTNPSIQTVTVAKEKESNAVTATSESIEEEINAMTQDTVSRTTQSQISEISQTSTSKSSKKVDKSITSDRDISKKQHSAELKTSSKRKNSKYQKTKSSSSISENILGSKSGSHILEEVDQFIKYHDKGTKVKNELLQLVNSKEGSILDELDLNESQTSLQALVKRHSRIVKDKSSKLSSESTNESKENGSAQISSRRFDKDESLPRNERDTQNASMSQISTFAVSHHSSEESEKDLSKSIVVRSQDRQFEQILNARETALASRKNCVEEWMAWHARLRAEEERVTRMEQAAFKLIAAASNVLCQQGGDTTVSSDTSDVEGRIGLLTEKLAERRLEMARLKREAKKQAKKQLRALEANLLNQIKKYDTTIYEMRKKLESKKEIKETDKLAIEPKLLADFKVPEIPLKRIQDIYKSSDLLRSRSESDLLTRNQQKVDLSKVVIPIAYDDRDSFQKPAKSADIRNAKVSELKGTMDFHDSARTIFDDYASTEVYEKIRTTPSASPTSNDAHSEKYALSTKIEEFTANMKQTSASHVAEDAKTDLSTVQTMSDTRFEDRSTINTESADVRLITDVDQSQPKTSTMLSEIPEISNKESIEYSKSIPSKSECSTEDVARVTNSGILTYSRKLDFLQLNNKNLSEDISSIEKDIKALSEIMSRLGNESNEKSKANNDERNTSQDISEMISKSVFSEAIDIKNEEQQAVSPEKEINTESPSISLNNRKSIPSDDSSHDKYISDRISSEISAIIPEEASIISNSPHEIDYEAKSREIMNEIEKSVVSQHIKIANDDNPPSVLESGNEELLNDLVSELGIKSISEILSKVSESRKSLDLAKDTATQIIDEERVSDSKRSIKGQSDLSEAILEKGIVEAQTEEVAYPLKLSEHFSTTSLQSPIIAGHRSKEAISQGDSRSAPSSISNQNSHVLAGEDLKSRNILEAEVKIDIADDVRNLDGNQSRTVSAGNVSQDKDDWTTSESFEVPQDEISTGVREEFENSRSGLDDTSNNFSEKNVSLRIDDATNQEAESNLIGDMSAFLPKGESTNVAVQDVTFDDTLAQSQIVKSNDELDDILDIIARENDKEKSISESEKFDNVISDSMAELLDRVKDIENDRNVDNRFKGFLYDTEISIDNQTEAISNASMLNDKVQKVTDVGDVSENNVCEDNKASNREEIIDTLLRTVDATDDKSAINVNLYVEIDNEESPREAVSEVQEIIITELDSSSAEDNVLSELEIDAKVELAEEEEFATCDVNEDKNERVVKGDKGDAAPVEITECLEPISEQDSSDGEQLDNLVEVAVSELDFVEKIVEASHDSPKSVIDDAAFTTRTERAEEEIADDIVKKSNEAAPVSENINKTFDILKDPEYEDISEESLEVSEILDKDDLPRVGVAKKSINLPERYQTTQRSEDVLRILDEISQKSSFESASNSQNNERNAQSALSATEEISEIVGAEVSAGDDSSSPEMNRTTGKFEEESCGVDEAKGRFLERAKLQDGQSVKANDADGLSEKREVVSLRLDEDDKSSQIIYELRERVSQLQEQNGSSESSEAGDTPRGVSEIEMDSPRDFNDSRLNIDILDDDLLSGTKANQSIDMEANFHSASITTSEKDIEAMIHELKASLEQPGQQEVAEFQAKLLRIEQLQIELEIKKLEAEEVYYVREIPNKPPPPYTPPGRLSAALGSPSLVTAVIPSNVEELTSFTEKATALIYNAKLTGEDIANLEAPPEIYELNEDKSERRDRQIYNTFLFDLCKETIVEVYRSEYEKPGPSWTKPNVKTKPTMKIPRNVEELTEYVNKEVATLFGFKTKLQRENMVMRWSRKRRDRVDELLAREAQAEEDEWTKFHHDELAVKNGLTVAILDTLVMETANVMKIAYGKKRRMMV
ncbi:PREDICTED: centrosome-associated protein 350-like isoform X2 [Wasmannia auropunctata]|uniref:centrosome-associated protein 350-like isoform X2 n=1 Tax=Wasmannia auropunctata TaxID=64793 RepID=UPI0005F0C1FD|nr:PREDICTED: centrosome-associated protein 350-like isoform X2 [Wasmannia auropunctata]